MSDKLFEERLAALGNEARRRLTDPEQLALDALAAGTLAPDARAALYARAAGDPDLSRALVAYEPFGAEALERVLAAVEAAPCATDACDAAGAERFGVPSADVQERLLARSARAGRRWALAWSGAGVIAVAAAGLLAWLGGPEAAHPLPGYALRIEGDQRVMRGSSTQGATDVARRTIDPQSELKVLLRPATAVVEPLEVRAFAAQGGQTRAWPARVQRAPGGAAKLALEPLPGAATGPAELIIWLGHARLAPQIDARALRTAVDGPNQRMWTVPLQVRDGAP